MPTCPPVPPPQSRSRVREFALCKPRVLLQGWQFLRVSVSIAGDPGKVQIRLRYLLPNSTQWVTFHTTGGILTEPQITLDAGVNWYTRTNTYYYVALAHTPGLKIQVEELDVSAYPLTPPPPAAPPRDAGTAGSPAVLCPASPPGSSGGTRGSTVPAPGPRPPPPTSGSRWHTRRARRTGRRPGTAPPCVSAVSPPARGVVLGHAR